MKPEQAGLRALLENVPDVSLAMKRGFIYNARMPSPEGQ